MKNIIRTLLASSVLLSLGTSRATADDEALAALGGFVAGIITHAAINDYHDRDRHADVRVIIRDDDCDHRGRCDHRPRDYRDDHYDRRHDSRHDAGFWKVERVRVWVPGRWEVSYNRCGDRIRTWRSGYYRVEERRVWVPERGRGKHRDRCG